MNFRQCRRFLVVCVLLLTLSVGWAACMSNKRKLKGSQGGTGRFPQGDIRAYMRTTAPTPSKRQRVTSNTDAPAPMQMNAVASSSSSSSSSYTPKPQPSASSSSSSSSSSYTPKPQPSASSSSSSSSSSYTPKPQPSASSSSSSSSSSYTPKPQPSASSSSSSSSSSYGALPKSVMKPQGPSASPSYGHSPASFYQTSDQDASDDVFNFPMSSSSSSSSSSSYTPKPQPSASSSSSSSSSSYTPKPQPSASSSSSSSSSAEQLVNLPGALASFCASTGTTLEQLQSTDTLQHLVDTSTRLSGVSATHVSNDWFLLTPRGPAAAKTADAWHAIWQSHLAGVEATAEARRNAIFLNWAEPVVDIVLVVVLFNPVNTHLDQRQSATVQLFWDAMNAAAGEAGLPAPNAFVTALERRTVFLDLVPVLDDGSSGDAELTAAVDNAAKSNAYGPYFAKRMEAYANMNPNLEVVFAPGSGDRRNKNKVREPALKRLSGMHGVTVTDVLFHPSAMRNSGNPQYADLNAAARAKYAALLPAVVKRLAPVLLLD